MMEINKIYLKDCITFMKEWKGQKVDVIVTSPPYNFNKKYSKYKDNKMRDDYIKWMGEVAKNSKEILADNGSFFLNIVGKPTDPWLAFDVAKEFHKYFELQNTIHWIKSIALNIKEKGKTTKELNGDFAVGHFKPLNSDKYFNQCHEYIFHFTKSGEIVLDKLAVGVPYSHSSNLVRWKTKNNKRDRGNVWFLPYENKQGAFIPIEHPAEFPEKLPLLCIKAHGIKKNMLVYDPFIGLGNTALACIRLNVGYIGTDVDNNYIDISKKRIEQHKKELSQQKL
jgi:site-specific DNA-methyltransferase (adenine-specific)